MNELVAYSKGRKSFIKDDFYYDLAYSEEHGFAGNDNSFDCIYQSYRVISQRMNDTLNIHPEVALLNKLHYQICNCPYVRQIAILKNKRIVQLNIPVNKSI